MMGMAELLRTPGTKEYEARQRALAVAAQISGVNRVWAPIRKKGEWTETPKAPTDYGVDRALPVRVQVKVTKQGSTLLETYPDYAAFEREHNVKSYPVKGTAVLDGHTVVLVTAKPWAGKIAAVPGIEKPTPPTKRQVRSDRADRVEGAVLSHVTAQGVTRRAIQDALEAEGFDKSMLDNSLGGRLDRLAREGRLVKEKGPGVVKGKPREVVVYRLIVLAPGAGESVAVDPDVRGDV